MDIKEFWANALAARLFPLSIGMGTKAPIGLWRENSHPTPEPHPSASAVGIRCLPQDGISAIDVDCLCMPAAQNYRDILGRELGAVPVRYGRRPKFLIPFRCEGPIEGRSLPLPCGCKVQILSGQFVAWGEHPDTHQLYEWEGFANPWPLLNQISLYAVLSYLGVNATADPKQYVNDLDLTSAAPHSDAERDNVRQYTEWRLKQLTDEIRNRSEGRGIPIFNAVASVAPAVQWGVISQEEINSAIESAGHALDDKRGGRTLGEEVTRALDAGVLTGNPLLQRMKAYRDFAQQVLASGETQGGKTFATMSKMQFPPRRFAIDELLPHGFILFAAKPKVGKSFVWLEMALSIAEGGTFWGRHCADGPVLIYSFEDNDERMQARYHALRPRGIKDEGRLLYFTGESGVPRVAALPGEPCFTQHLERELIKRPDIRMVVIDPIVRIRADQKDKTKSLYQVDYDNIHAIQRIAAKHRVPILGIHHANKRSETADAGDAVSGSTGLTAAADGFWSMETDKERENATLQMEMRDTTSQIIPLTKRRDGASIRWEPLETMQDIGKATDIERRILTAVMSGGCEATVLDLIARCPGINENTLRVYVRRMSHYSKSMLEHTQRGLYVVPGSAPKSRPEGARDMLLTAATSGTYADFQAGKMVNVMHVLPHLARNDKAPVTEGYAVSLDVARSLLSIFHDPNKLIKDMEGRKLAFVFDKVLLIPHTDTPVQVSAPPVQIITLTEAMKQVAQMPWAPKLESFPWS